MAETPYALIGTLKEIEAKLERIRSRWGITRFAVRLPAFEGVSALLK